MTAKAEDSPARDRNGSLQYDQYYIRGYLQGAVSEGCDPYVLLQKAGIQPDAYDNPDATLDGKQLLSLIKTIMYTLDDVYLGFLEEPGKKAMEHEITRVAVKSETLGNAVRNLLRFQAAIRNDMVRGFGSNIPAHEFYVQFVYKDLKPGLNKHLFYFYRFAYNYRIFSWFIGKPIKLTRVSFSTPEPANGVDCRHYFNCEVMFNQPWDALHFDSDYLSLPIQRVESELGQDSHDLYLSSHPDWNHVPSEQYSFSRKVRRIIETHYETHGGFPSMRQVAETFNLTPRTLSRHLDREGSSFRDIKLDSKQQEAEKLLQETELPISKIAEKLGFNEPGHFARAFQHRAGITPSRYRKGHQT